MYTPDSAPYKAAWQATIDAAEKLQRARAASRPSSASSGPRSSRATTCTASSSTATARTRASQMVAYTTVPPIGSTNPRDLWKWMAGYEAKTGGRVLAIPHNGNLSNGIMFPLDAQYDGTPLDEELRDRARASASRSTRSPRSRATARPTRSSRPTTSSPTSRPGTSATSTSPRRRPTPCCPASTRARRSSAVSQIEARLGTNPYQFGLIGSTDSHTSLATAEENNFFGKHSGAEPKPDRMTHPFMKNETGEILGWQHGRVGSGRRVGDREHPRGHSSTPWSARRSTPPPAAACWCGSSAAGTSTPKDLESRTPALAGFKKGVPMGGDLAPRGDAEAPTFLVYALRDPIGANLDRIQIVKGWIDAERRRPTRRSTTWSGRATASPRADGKLPAVGNTVDREARELRQHDRRRGARHACGPTRTSTRRRRPSTTRGCSRSRRRAGPPSTPSASASPIPEGRAGLDPGACLHVADLVRPGRLTGGAPRQRCSARSAGALRRPARRSG